MVSTVVMSFGFHYYETTQPVPDRFSILTSIPVPMVFGKLRSIAAASNIGVGILIFLISSFLDFKDIYLAIGGLVMAAGMWGFTRNPTDKKHRFTAQKKMIFRKKYWLYYFLTFMAGARAADFHGLCRAAAGSEIRVYGAGSNGVVYHQQSHQLFFKSHGGKMHHPFSVSGKSLSLEYFSLIFIFMAYAAVDSKMLVSVLYILDHIFFNFAIAIRTYFQKIGDPKDIAPSMAVGFTINHIAAVFLPALGGILWMVDYRIPFVAGAGLSLISLMAVQKIRLPVGRRISSH